MMYHLSSTFFGTVNGDGKSHEPFVFFGFIIDYCFERLLGSLHELLKAKCCAKVDTKNIVKYRRI